MCLQGVSTALPLVVIEEVLGQEECILLFVVHENPSCIEFFVCKCVIRQVCHS